MAFVHVALAPAPFDPAALLTRLAKACPDAGGVASFTGLVRPAGAGGAVLHQLYLDHHPALTLPSLGAIARETQARFALLGTIVVHRCGAVGPGEPIVLAAAAAAHRRAAFQAVDHAMDRLKSEAVFWKREEGVDGAHWIEPTEADHADLARWTGAGRA